MSWVTHVMPYMQRDNIAAQLTFHNVRAAITRARHGFTHPCGYPGMGSTGTGLGLT